MPPLIVLGQVPVPDYIKAYVPGVMASWPRERREVWEVHPPKPSNTIASGQGQFLELPAVAFLEQALRSLGLTTWDTRGHSMVVFGDVGLHPDEGTKCNGKAGSIFHLVVEGTATLHLPKVRDKALRKLRLEPGLAFVFNPNVHHAVTDTSIGAVATLSAIVPRHFARDSIPLDITKI
jgi:hypothetical protein